MRAALLDRIDAGVPLRRAARRVRPGPPRRAPARPLGVKLELTHRCNLRCGFCYTDSPRHTLARTPDLDDDAWRRIVAEAIDLGIIEAVVTGGEPLLRRDLTLELVERLDAAGIGITLNTNGWFVDGALADRLAGLRGITAQISVDGASAAAHDGARGVPGSWRRAIQAADLLLARGVRVHVLHVVTPDNEHETAEFLEEMWVLGVPRVRLSPVVQLGAAARSGRWHVERRPLHALARDFERRHGGRISVQLLNPAATVAGMGDKVPASMLVRPDGTARMESFSPFAFGNVAREGVAACWARMAAGWSDPRIRRWGHDVKDPAELHRSELVPYRDPDVELPMAAQLAAAADEVDVAPPLPPLPRAAAPRPAEPGADREYVRDLALRRRYRLGALRHGADADGSRLVRVVDARRVVRVNHTAAMIMDACEEGTVHDLVGRVAAAYPEVARGRLEDDVLMGLRDLTERGVVRPALSAGRLAGDAGEPVGDDFATV